MSIEDPKTPEKQMMEEIVSAGIKIIPGANATLIGKEIVFGGYKDLPDEDKLFLEDVAKVCQKYLNMQTLVDKFGSDHNARRKWRTEVSGRYRNIFNNFYQNDRMRLGNCIVPVVENLRTVIDGTVTWPQTVDATNLLVLQSELPDYSNYNNLSSEDKVIFSQSLADVCRKYLEIVYGQG